MQWVHVAMGRIVVSWVLYISAANKVMRLVKWEAVLGQRTAQIQSPTLLELWGHEWPYFVREWIIHYIILGTIVIILNTLPDFLISFHSKPIERLWQTSLRFRKVQQATSGACLIGLGAYLALSGTDNHLAEKDIS